MILWKALYNPDFGPINAAIHWLSDTFHLGIDAPQWLLSTPVKDIATEVERHYQATLLAHEITIIDWLPTSGE